MTRPGPKPTSCLTCKQRHKKCDQRVPACVKCEQDKVGCLGYGHILDTTKARGSSRRLVLIRPRPRPETGGSEELERGVREGGSLRKRLPEDSVAATFDPVHTNAHDHTPSSVACNSRSQRDNLPLCTTPQVMESPIPTFRKVAGLYVQLPRHTFDPLKTLLNNPLFDEYLLVQHTQLVDKWYFKPIDIEKQLSRASIVSVLQTPVASVSRWIALIGFGIYEAFIKGDASYNQLHRSWMEYIGNLLRRELSSDSTLHEVQIRRRDLIHVSLLRTLVVHSSNVYQVLRSVTPAFLQSAFSNPALWPSGSNPAYIPLMSILTMGSHELAYFTLIDCACAMAFGLPQLVEYDTTMYALPTPSSHQWAHCSPTEFQVVLAEINACRDKSPAARDWREIERWLLAWQSRPGEHTFTESWMTVAWYAVQESWRLVLLIYLYLAVCDTPSDNPQIQSYLKQILSVIGTVKKRGSEANVSFFIHHLIVGICACSEVHRKAVRDKLSAHQGTRFWLTRASDFVPVLDHLWHGAGADGRPIRWSDYMRSREAILPVV
ncbi:hypothetical protein ACGC1H_005978 [Rhizoctonia solani]